LPNNASPKKMAETNRRLVPIKAFHQKLWPH
jgi:hypothetical protein